MYPGPTELISLLSFDALLIYQYLCLSILLLVLFQFKHDYRILIVIYAHCRERNALHILL